MNDTDVQATHTDDALGTIRLCVVLTAVSLQVALLCCARLLCSETRRASPGAIFQDSGVGTSRKGQFNLGNELFSWWWIIADAWRMMMMKMV